MTFFRYASSTETFTTQFDWVVCELRKPEHSWKKEYSKKKHENKTVANPMLLCSEFLPILTNFNFIFSAISPLHCKGIGFAPFSSSFFSAKLFQFRMDFIGVMAISTSITLFVLRHSVPITEIWSKIRRRDGVLGMRIIEWQNIECKENYKPWFISSTMQDVGEGM